MTAKGEQRHLKQLSEIQRNLYEKFLIKVTMQHREHIILEFCDQVSLELQEKLFRSTILSTINEIRDMLPKSCFGPDQGVVFDTSLNLLVYEILQGLAQRYKTLIDKTASDNLDAIKAKDDL